MKEMWPYLSISEEQFLEKCRLAEKILQKYGAEHVGRTSEICNWIFEDGCNIYEETEKNIWKIKNEYIKVDKMYFPDEPFIVLEFSEEKNGPYEDADPFPASLTAGMIEQEIKYILGIDEI